MNSIFETICDECMKPYFESPDRKKEKCIIVEEIEALKSTLDDAQRKRLIYVLDHINEDDSADLYEAFKCGLIFSMNVYFAHP